MTDIVLLRHGRTEWNEAGRFQGRRDVLLSEAGRAALRGSRLPRPYRAWRAVTSPLGRAVETARLVGLDAAAVEPRLVELDYGEWEGRTMAEIRHRYGADAVAALEARGLDFRPPGGESPRELRARLGAWLDAVRAAGEPVVAVTHKGVIQMALALATGWDLVSKPPVRLDWGRAHRFTLPPGDGLALVSANLALDTGRGK